MPALRKARGGHRRNRRSGATVTVVAARELADYLLPDGLPRPRLRGWLHLGAVPVAVALGVVLLVLAPTSRAIVAGAVYAASLVGLLAVSATYHRGRWRPGVRAWLRRVDHAMIFLLIAGTYTPLCLLTIGDRGGTLLLAGVWAGAAFGVAINLAPVPLPRWLSVATYLALGWAAVAALPALVDALGPLQLALILAGGLFYSAGAVVYWRKRPDPAPLTFGYHELFHVLTLAAAGAHYVLIAGWVVPGAAG